jgi:hypothetical protein
MLLFGAGWLSKIRSAALLSPLILCLLLSVCAPASDTGWKHIEAKKRSPLKENSAMSTTNTAPHGGPGRSVRLIFEYEGDRVRLVSQMPVDLAVTGFDLPHLDHPGYYVDARDANDATLARVPARNAFVGSAEVFPEKPGEPIHRIDVPQQKGAFTVVVPAPQATDHVTVLQVSAPPPGAAAGPAPAQVTDLVSFPLDLKR